MGNSIMQTYHIEGMSCDRFVAGVKQKLSSIAGITSRTIDLGKNQAVITSVENIKTDILCSAIMNANYTISEL